MALNLHAAYPVQVATDPNYPYGKPRNVSVPKDGTGFPLEQAWVSDLQGFLQAILVTADITPSEVPDTAAASQYLDGLRSIFIDAVGGGTYAPSSKITIGGAGVEFPTSFLVSGHAGFTGAITVTGGTSFFLAPLDSISSAKFATLTITDTSVFQGLVSATAGMLLSGGLGVSGDAVFNNGLSVDGNASIGGQLSVSGLLRAIGSGLSIEANSTITKRLVASGEGRVVERVASGSDANIDIGVELADTYYIPSGTLTADRNWTVLNAGQNGDRLTVSKGDAQTLALVRENASTIVLMGNSASRQSVELIRASGQWELLRGT